MGLNDAKIVYVLHDFSFFDEVILIHGSFSHHLDGHVRLAHPFSRNHSLREECYIIIYILLSRLQACNKSHTVFITR